MQAYCFRFYFLLVTVIILQKMVVISSRAPAMLVIRSRGVQQGDPLGPSLFALAVHSAAQEARRDTEQAFPSGLDICAFYLDDGLCAGSAPAVSFFLFSLTSGLSHIGLVVNLSKTEVIPACTASQTFLGPAISLAALGTDLPPSNSSGQPLGPRTGVRHSSAAASVGRSGGVLPLSPATSGNCVTVFFFFAYPLISPSAHCVIPLWPLTAAFAPSLGLLEYFSVVVRWPLACGVRGHRFRHPSYDFSAHSFVPEVIVSSYSVSFQLTSVAQLGLVRGAGVRPLALVGARWCLLVFSSRSSIFRP